MAKKNENLNGKRVGEEPKEHKPNWRERYATVEEIEEFLSGQLYLRRNVVKRCVECRVPIVVRRTADEMHAMRLLMAGAGSQEQHAHTDDTDIF